MTYKQNPIAIGVVLIGVFFLGLYLYQSRGLTESECYRLGSNERTQLCLAKFVSPTLSPSQFSPADLTLLTLGSQKMSGGYTPVYQATLQNNSLSPAINAVGRFRFYKSGGSASCDNSQIDTQYEYLTKFINTGDTQSIRLAVSTPADTTSGFRWCVDVVGANLP